ncbi:MAG: sugar phosphate isomerase/epimerase family protein [Armatimonadota bacterium]|nr:sugar phosphate isomerase/epimerase family protein [Armatimonadota bacterium]
MRLVFPAYVPGAERIEDAVRAIARQGVGWVEWGLGSPAYFDEEDPTQVRSLRAVFRETGVRPNSLHARFGANYDLASLDPQVRAHTLQAQRRAIEVAGELEVPYLVLHPGHGPRGEEMSARLSLAAEGLHQLEPLARAAGVVLAVENLPPTYPGCASEVLELVHALHSSAVRVCFDSGHAHLQGDVAGAARQLLPFTVTMHLHDNHGQKDEHLLPGMGGIDWRAFTAVCAEATCPAPALLECAPPEGWTWSQCAQFVCRYLPCAKESEPTGA